MPMVRYRIRNECGLANPAVYLTAEKDDPEALLEGVAMAGLVGVLRQLGDLAEFAAEIFHDLHEEVMATASRGHGLLFRVLQLEAEFPLIEKSILSETVHLHYAHNAGIDWQANIRVEHNSVIQGDMPRFILDSYEECRSPPRLFMLDKFDVAGAGACLTRYSNPSFFKTTSTSFETMESEVQREKRTRKHKKNESYWRSGETTESLFTPMLDNLQFSTTEQVPEKFPARHAKLKHRKMIVSDIRCKKSYMENLFKEESFELNDPRSSSSDCHNNKIADWAPEMKDILFDGVTDSSVVGMEFSLEPPKDETTGKVQNAKNEDGENLETVSISSCVTKKIYPCSQIDEEAILVGLGNEMENHALDLFLAENDMIPPPLNIAMQRNRLAVSGFLTDDDHGSSTSDDIGSELENYVDALNTMEFEIGTDYESRARADLSLFNPEFQGENLSISRHPQSSESCIGRSFNILATTEKKKDEMPILSQSVTEKSFCMEINHRKVGNLERMCKDMELVPSINLASNEACHQNLSSATIVSPVNNKEFSNYCKTDSALKPKHNVEETKSLNKHSNVVTSGGTKINSKVGKHAESSFLPWLTNHFSGNSTFKECSDIFAGILEEIDTKDHTEERPSESTTVKDNMPSILLEIGHCILPENGPAEYSKISLNDEFGQPLEVLERDKNDCISGCSFPSVLMGSTVLESQNTSSDLEIDMQSEDLPTKIFLNNMKSNDEEAKQFNSSVLFPAEPHMLPLALSNDSGSHGSTQTSENGNDLVYISDERGSPCGCQNKAAMDQLSGHGEKGTFNDMASTLEMLKSPQTQRGSCHVDISSGCPKDSLPDSVEDDVTYSVENFSPKSLASYPDIVSSILHPLSLASVFESANVTLEESVHQQTPLGFGNVDISGNESLISPAIADELKHSSGANETLGSCNRNMLKPLLSAYQEDLIRNHLQSEVSELTKRNGNEHVLDGLELANGSTALSVGILTENGIPKDIIDDQVLNKPNSAKVIDFDILTLDDRLSDDNTLHQHKSHIKEPVITRDSALLQSENKPLMLLTLNEMLEMANSVSRNQSSTPELPRLSESELVDAEKEDKTSAGKMEQDFDFKSVNTEENSDTEVLSLLQPSDVCNFVVQFHDVPVSKDVLNFNMPLIELDNAKSHSNCYSMTLDGTNYQISNLLEFSSLCSDDAQIQRVSVSEDASLNQHKTKLEEIAITNGLTSLMLGSKVHLSLCKNEGHTSIVSLKGSREDVQDSNLCASMQQCHTDSESLEVLSENASVFEAVENDKFIENLSCSREDKQDLDPDVHIQHCQTDAERIELLFENASKAVDETSVSPLYRAVKNFEPTHIHMNKVLSFDPTIIQYNLEPEHETFLSHGCSDELNMSLSKTYKNEQLDTNITVSFQIDSAYPGSSLTSEMASGSVIIGCPISTVRTHEYTLALSGEMISISPTVEEGIEETPQPPLPPIQWIMGKTGLGSLMGGAQQTIMESNMHMNLLPVANEKMILQSVPPSVIEESFLTDSPCVDCKLKESFNLSEFPAITINQKQQDELYSSTLSFFSSQADEKYSYINITTDPNNQCTIAPSLEDVPQHPNFLETVPPQSIDKSRSSLVNFLPGLELERSLEASIRDRDGIQPLSSFMLMPINGNGMYQHGYGDYEYYEGENMRYHNLLTPFPVSAHSIPHYGYQIIQRNGNSSITHDMMLPDIEVDRLNGKQRSILNKPRDPLIEAVAAHDKSTMRKVSELDQLPMKPKDDEKNLLLEQIKNKSLNLKPTTSKANMIKAPSTNLKVAAILEKANAIRMACVGSDEEEEGDDDWNDS